MELVGTANARRAPSGRSRLDAALEKDSVGVRVDSWWKGMVVFKLELTK